MDTIIDGPPDIENVTEALQKTPYGLCVYESQNDVVDQQVRASSTLCFPLVFHSREELPVLMLLARSSTSSSRTALLSHSQWLPLPL